MGYRSHIFYEMNFQTRTLDGAERRLAAGTRTLYVNIDASHTLLDSLLCGVLRGELRGKGRALPRSLEAGYAAARPGNDVPLGVGYGNDGIVEARLYMDLTHRDVLLYLLLARFLRLRHLAPLLLSLH